MKKINIKLEQKIMKLRSKGLTYRQIALKAKTNHGTISNVVRKYFGKQKQGRKVRINHTRVIELSKLGHTNIEISKMFICCKSSISKILTAYWREKLPSKPC